MCMVKRWLTPQVWQTRISPRIFLKVQHVHGQKMIDPPGMTDLDLSYNFFKDSTYAWVKRWLTPPRYDRPGSLLEFFVKNSTCAWSKDDWLPRYDQDLSYNFFKDSICAWSKDDWPPTPKVWQTRISFRIFCKDSTCTWSKDDWPPPHPSSKFATFC